MFQANAIQFGLDQLLEAATPKLISFIQWYYWAQNVGSLVFFYVVIRSFSILDVTDEKINATITHFLNGNVDYTIIACFLIVTTISVTAVLSTFCYTKNGGFQRRKFQTRTRFFSLPPLPTTHYVILHHYNDIHKQRLIIHGVNYIHAIPRT